MALNRMKLIEMTFNRMTSAKRDGALLEWIYFCDILKGGLHLFYLSNSYLDAILGERIKKFKLHFLGESHTHV
jgi:hypothetical protein